MRLCGSLSILACESWDYKESWALKNWYFCILVLEKTLESPLNWKVIKLVNPKGNQSWIVIGRTDVEAETPILWSPDAKKLTHWKRPWCWERLKARGEGDDGGWVGWMASQTRWTWVWVGSKEAWGAAIHGAAKSRTRRSDWTELKWTDGRYHTGLFVCMNVYFYFFWVNTSRVVELPVSQWLILRNCLPTPSKRRNKMLLFKFPSAT